MKKVLGLVSVIIIVIVILVISLILGTGIGNGNGNGNGDDNGQSVVSVSDIDEKSVIIETTEIEYVNVTVSGNKYIFDNAESSLEELIDSLKNLSDGGVSVKIKDDNASLKAYRALIKLLDDNKIKYINEENK